VAALLNILGYNASSLDFGMSSWTRNGTIVTGAFNTTQHQHSYPTEVSTRSGPEFGTRQCGGEGGSTEFTGSSYEWDVLRQSIVGYVNRMVSEAITAEAVYNILYDNYTANDPFLLDTRASGDHVSGHIRTSINIEEVDVLKAPSLAKLPKDKQMIVYCHRGQESGHVVALLNINGYDAIGLEYGMCSWTDDVAVVGGTCYDPATDGNNYRVCFGSNAGLWTEGAPAD